MLKLGDKVTLRNERGQLDESFETYPILSGIGEIVGLYPVGSSRATASEWLNIRSLNIFYYVVAFVDDYRYKVLNVRRDDLNKA